MRILLLSGSLPPDVCGVGNYTDHLCREFQSMGLDARAEKISFRVPNDWTALRLIRKRGFDIIHLQYPTIGFGNSLGPHLLSLACPLVVTLHEMSQLHPIKRFFEHAFSVRARGVLFTTEKEKTFAMRWRWWHRVRSEIIPVGSNIPAMPSVQKDFSEIVFFGMIRPHKGLEEFLGLAELIHQQGLPLTLRVIGSPDARKLTYYNDMRQRSNAYRVIWDIGLPDAVVADKLARTRFAYMPFPDGASGYRTSLLALLANGVAVVSNIGKGTSSEMEQVISSASSPHEALVRFLDLMKNPTERARLEECGRRFSRTRGWRQIAQKHISFYEDIHANSHRP